MWPFTKPEPKLHPGVELLISSLNFFPFEWEKDSYLVINHKRKISLWWGGGPTCLSLWESPTNGTDQNIFTWKEKRALSAALKRWAKLTQNTKGLKAKNELRELFRDCWGQKL